METIKIKHRTFEIIERLSLDNFIVERKGKQYFVRQFDPKSQEGKELAYCLKNLSTSGVKIPKLHYLDDRNGFAVSEIIIGEKMSDYLSHSDMSEELFEQLFRNAYFAKVHSMTLDYDPEWWTLVNNTLYYTRPIFIKFQKEKDLADHYIRLWFNTHELAKYLAKLGISYDKSRIKDEYSTNKQVVLTVLKHYR